MTHSLATFYPPWYLRNGHVQTILTGFYKPKASLPTPIIHRVPLGIHSDKGFSLLYENDARSESHRDNYDEAVMLLHGLGSSHAGTYMTNIASELIQRHYRVFRADLPGAGPSGELTPLPPHGACFEEVWQMLIWARDNLGIRRWRIAGVSLGGNILLKLLSIKHQQIDSGDGSREISILQGIAVAPPIRLSDCSTHMERGVHRLYANYFLGSLKKQAMHRATLWPEWKEQMKKASFASIRRFDETVTAPMAGFKDAEEYYATGSSAAWLDQIEVPTTVLIDEDDPIVPAWMFEKANWSATTTVKRTKYGGHVGYLYRPKASSAFNSAHSASAINGAGFARWADIWIANEIMGRHDDNA